MKILYIITRDGIGGAQSHLASLLENLDNSKVELCIGSNGSLVKFAKSKNIKVHVLSLLDSPFFILSIPQVYLLIRKFRPDILHLHSTNAAIVGRISSLLAFTKVVYTVHGWNLFNRRFGVIGSSALIFIERLLKHTVGCWIVLSKFDYLTGLKNNTLRAGHVHIIPNGVNQVITESFVFPSSIPRDAFNIAFIGRACEQKKPLEALHVLEFLSNHFYLTMFLSGENVEQYRNKINKSLAANRVNVVLNEANAARFLASFDLLIMTSDYEGMPLVALEAMSVGLPIVTTNVCGMSEIVIDGESGYLVKTGCAKLMAEKIQSLSRDTPLMEFMSSKSKELYKKNYTVELMVDKTKSVYQSLK